MKIITSGKRYLDIDAYAGCIAYAELLNSRGEEVMAVSTALPNESVNDTVRSWGDFFETNYVPTKDDEFIIIDVSNPDHFDKIVKLEKVYEVIDHHIGHEEYWQSKLGDKAEIEFIGSVCTLIYERWQVAGVLKQMNPTTAKLLMCGILDNTLNFGAKVTTKRDIDAYKSLRKIADVQDDFAAQYFSDCQKAIMKDLASAVKNDSKIMIFKALDKPVAMGQLAVWDASEIITNGQDVIRQVLFNIESNWAMNLINISESKSYFITDNVDVQKYFEKLLAVKFDGGTAVANRLWLRKEIVKQDIESI
ncbi:MAG: DHH family phosphoesterase [Candidatus Nanosyncoccaceae bacterium]|jgi:inorganic pyrophosphatase